jgi:hypothetical protein
MAAVSLSTPPRAATVEMKKNTQTAPCARVLNVETLDKFVSP